MALRVVVVYLGVALVPLAMGIVGGSAPFGLLVAHVVVTAAVVAWARGWQAGTGPGQALAAWVPLLLLPLLYAELPALMAGLHGDPVTYGDAIIASVELALFGAEPAYAWAGAWPWRWLSEPLHLCYLLFYPLIYVPPLMLWLGKMGPGGRDERRAAFGEVVLALTLAWAACYAVMIVFPVQGPRYLGVPEGVPEGPVRGLVLAILESGSSRGAAFPSSHVAISVAQVVATFRWQRRLAWILAFVTVGLTAGAVYGGFHYAVDAVAGAVVGAGCAALVRLWGDRKTPAEGRIAAGPEPAPGMESR
ncbi:MAG TPA: phosphatase PAP2 family protein [Longimicrobiales bacterium]|jgi:membrane-associated phospholipid phosphatase